MSKQSKINKSIESSAKWLSILIIVAFLVFAAVDSAQAADTDACLLTDLSSDGDDLGALQVTLYYHKLDMINLRCVIMGTSNANGHRVIKHMIEWWGFNIDDIRVGDNKLPNFEFKRDWLYVDPYIEQYDLPEFEAEDGGILLQIMTSIYPQLLVIEVGPPITTYNAGVRDDIGTYYQMGGAVEPRAEFNANHIPIATNYIEPIDTYWLDFWVGDAYKSGHRSVFSHETPVKFVYDTYAGGNGGFSWDPFTVIWAVEKDTWFDSQPGNMIVHDDGSTTWVPGLGGDHVAVHKNVQAVGDHLDNILALRPRDVRNNRTDGQGPPNRADIVPILQLLLLDD